MKVLFLSNLFPDSREPYRGLDNATLLHHLTDRCEIRVLAPRASLPMSTFRPRSCRPDDKAFEPLYPKTFYVPKAGSYFNHHLFAAAIRRPLLELRQEFPFDVILVSWTFPDTAAVAMLQRVLHVPFVSIVQGSDAHVYLHMHHRREVIVHSLNKASAVITRSAKLGELLREAGVASDKVRPIYNGVDLEMFQPPASKQQVKFELGLDSHKPMLLFVGNFFLIKNPLLLIRAHAELCRRFPSRRCQLVMVGGGPLEDVARKVADENGFGQEVVLVGRKLAPEVARYMQAADALCLSSENEGVPNVIMEAFASGIPVMSTAVGGIPEVVQTDLLGKLVGRGDLEAMVEAMAEILSRPPQTGQIRDYALQFSWENAADKYWELLENATVA